MTSSYPDANIWRWRSTNPSFNAHYICQLNVKSTKLVASKSTLNVMYGEDSVLCSSDSNPGPPVSWKINSQDVSTNTSERVYQIITQPTLDGNSTSRLYLTRGLHQNSGVYTCNATSLDQSAETIVISTYKYPYWKNALHGEQILGFTYCPRFENSKGNLRT
uniref:uncharacterized protein LOC108950633 n=1 Tax=Ciona intestinalis TaxID=7719 RepID=UPI00089DC0BD|nr:uncharacterized protein LOC108950633 [Ciona intestinalis]|eukprot:XP_018672189.1 uncharacterized protein LOC108950633 [Ciona intestinalis]